MGVIWTRFVVTKFVTPTTTVLQLSGEQFCSLSLTMIVQILLAFLSILLNVGLDEASLVLHPSISIRHQEYLVRQRVVKMIRAHTDVQTTLAELLSDWEQQYGYVEPELMISWCLS